MISRVDRNGMVTALTAITRMYSDAKSLATPPVTCTTVVMRTRSNTSWAYMKVSPGGFLLTWV